MISADLIGCSTARNKETCENRRSIRRDRLEGRVERPTVSFDGPGAVQGIL